MLDIATRGRMRTRAVACLVAALASVPSAWPCGAGAAAAQADTDVRAQIERAARTALVILELADGQTISGRFHGFVGDWRDTVDVAVRYEAWRLAHAEGAPRLGQPLLVFLAAGDTLRGEFKGVGPSFLVLGSGNSRFDVPANVGEITGVTSDEGAALAPWADLRGRMLDAPSYIGVGLKRGPQTILVSRESILAARGDGRPSGGNEMVLVLSVIAGAVLFCVLANQAQEDAQKDCSTFFDDLFSCQGKSGAHVADDPFGASDVSHGLKPWAPEQVSRP